MLKEMTRSIIDKAPYIFLPVPYLYRLVAVGEELWWRVARWRRASGSIHARIWIDQEMKKGMGY